jgi:hypothetical protein
MTHTTDRPERRTTPNDAASHRARGGCTRRRRAASVSDAVIAAYIHELRHADLPRSTRAGTP